MPWILTTVPLSFLPVVGPQKSGSTSTNVASDSRVYQNPCSGHKHWVALPQMRECLPKSLRLRSKNGRGSLAVRTQSLKGSAMFFGVQMLVVFLRHTGSSEEELNWSRTKDFC